MSAHGGYHRYGRTDGELGAAVAQGVARLNAYLPHWRFAFTTKRAYNFEDPCQCVLGTIGGQLARKEDHELETNWDRGRLALNLNRFSFVTPISDAQQHGFDWTDTDEIPTLIKLWDKEIGWNTRKTREKA